MIVTSHVVAYLIGGAGVVNNDINMVDLTAFEFDTSQICTEDDLALRKVLTLNDYQLVLEISEPTWHGTFSKYPNLSIMVTDGVSQMLLRPSARD
jgi:hypothetical protein